MDLDPERYERVHAILSEALELEAEALDAFLERVCDGDRELRDQVLQLLEAGRGGVFANAVSQLHVRAPSDTERAPGWMPERVGEYSVVRQIGRGGMGVVYEAEQASPKRRVALKLLHPTDATDGTLKRFRQEAELLGQLQHPGITQIFEASTCDLGNGPQPFFAMELVSGVPLMEYVRTHGLGISQRLELMARICDIVEYAHQRGVVHRDLKPANILVAPPDSSSGQLTPDTAVLAKPKVLDFGVARVTDLDGVPEITRTREGQLIGTVAYMSPEQAAGRSQDIDARSDVYALGVVTYELLAGRLPHALEGKSLPDALTAIREEDPLALGKVNGLLQGDVETLVGKALEKERSRRYPSAAAFAEDLRRYLTDQPIHARPPTKTYQLRKFAKRNKAVVAGVGGTLSALVLGLVGTLTYLFEARDQTARALLSAGEATLARDRLQATNDFLVEDLLRAANPMQVGRDAKVADLLDAAAKSVGARFADNPDLEAGMRSTLADTYLALGLGPEAEEQCCLALELVPSDSELAGWTRVTLAAAMRNQERIDESLAVYEELFEEMAEVLGPEHLIVLSAQAGIGHCLQQLGRHDEAYPLLERTVESLQRVEGPHLFMSIEAQSAMVGSLLARGMNQEALVVSSDATRRAREGMGPEDPATVNLLYNHLTILLNLGEFDEAASLGAEVYNRLREIYPPEHHMVWMSAYSYGMALARAGDPAAGIPYMVESFELTISAFGDTHYGLEVIAGGLVRACALIEDGEGVEHWRRRELHYRLMVGHAGELPLVLDRVDALREHRASLGNDVDVLESLVADAEVRVPPGHNLRMRYCTNLGRALVHHGRHGEAESVLLQAHQASEGTEGDWKEPDARLIAQTLVEVYTALGADDQADEWTARLE